MTALSIAVLIVEMLANFAQAFENIRSNVSRTHWSAITKNRAPHKPLLLLSIFDLMSEGLVKNNLIEITPDLCETFTLY